MEEQKNNQAMGVAENNQKVQNEGTQKLSYEQLNSICSELYQENQKLRRQLQQVNVSNMFKRLDYLFAVLQYESVIKDPEFINSCVEEIKSAMAVPEEEKGNGEE